MSVEIGEGYNDWLCSNCQFSNFQDRDMCKQCSTPNTMDSLVTVELPAMAASQQKRKHDEVSLADQSTWKCIDCSHRNHASASECFKCKTSQEVQLKRKKENPNNWVCGSCNNSNWPHRTICNRCKSLKPGMENQMRNVNSADKEWVCLNCDNNNRAFRQECNKCKLAKGEAVNPGIAQFRTNTDWLCMSCGNSNYPYRISCNKCSLPKQEAMTATRAPTNPLPDDDKSENWLCYNCDNVNLPFRTECNKCKIDKKSGTDPATAFKRSNTDWKCSVCYNLNFNYRVFCNGCQLPKSEIGEEVPPSDEQLYSPYEGGVPVPTELTGVPTEPIEQAAAQLYSTQQSAYQQGYQPKPASASYTILRDLVNNKTDNWSCHNCDNLNYPLRTHCNKCRMSKAEAIAPETRAGRASVGDSQWNCSECSNQNFHFRTECNKCKGPRPLRIISTVDVNGFYGGIGNNGAATVSADYGYGYSDPNFGAGFPVQSYNSVNSYGNNTQSYNSSQSNQPSQQQSDDPSSDWVCSQCRNVNWPKRTKCNKCGLDKGVASDPGQSSNPQSGYDVQSNDPDANWVCSVPECQNVNWPKRTKCNKCGVDKGAMSPALGGGSAEGDGNWVCVDCQNVNWPKRTKCNKCGVGKPGAMDSWTCSTCSHNNYSFASTCDSCGGAQDG